MSIGKEWRLAGKRPRHKKEEKVIPYISGFRKKED